MEKSSGIKLTLQNRIITLLIVSSVIFISVFTFIQLNNQISNINRFNYYQANLSNVIVKSSLESILKQANNDNIDPQSYIQSSLSKLKESGTIKEAIVFDKEGKVVAATQNSLIGENLPYKELSKFQDLEYVSNENKWFLPDVDKNHGQLYMYLALRPVPGEPMAYAARISFSLGNIQEALLQVFKPVVLAGIIIIILNILFGYFFSKTVIGPIKVLNKVTKIIAAGELSVRTDIRTDDELQELGLTFNYMAEELAKMKERAENANPLTKLPGNLVIREIIESKIKNNSKFMVIYCDLDNFKAFNDKYGIAKGDEAIKLTAEIFREAIKEKGDINDFIGHEGGDDFIMVSSPEKAQAIADYTILEFDKRIRSLYDSDDLTRGYIIAHARDNSIKQFPIMSISLAGVTNAHRIISSYGEVTNIAAEVKKKAKSMEGSNFFVDKRIS